MNILMKGRKYLKNDPCSGYTVNNYIDTEEIDYVSISNYYGCLELDVVFKDGTHQIFGYGLKFEEHVEEIKIMKEKGVKVIKDDYYPSED